MTQNGTIVGYFQTRKSADSAISALKDAGFTRDNIGLAIRTGSESVTGPSGEHREAGTWERIKGFFGAGPESSTSAEPRTEAELGEREPSRSFSYDEVHQSLSGLSVTDEEARYFQSRFGSGTEGAIVTVSAPGREEEAERIMQDEGADLGTSAAGYQYDESQRETPMGEGQNIRLYGEVLRVHTDRVNRGEARLHKEVHTSTQTVEVPVKHEELVVEREPVQGEQTAGSEASFEDKEIRIPLSEERAHVEKQPVVREEVRVGKREVTETEKFDEKVRSEDLKVDEDLKNKAA